MAWRVDCQFHKERTPPPATPTDCMMKTGKWASDEFADTVSGFDTRRVSRCKSVTCKSVIHFYKQNLVENKRKVVELLTVPPCLDKGGKEDKDFLANGHY